MKSYDDLQHFKEKTQTSHIKFREMSEHDKNADSVHWTIIKQLMNEGAESTLGNGQSVHIAAPQPIDEGVFSRPAMPSAPQTLTVSPHSPSRPAQFASITAFVAAKPSAQVGGSLLDSISALLKPTIVAEPSQPLASYQAPVVDPISPAPVPAASADLPRFKPLFSLAAEPPVTMLSKNTLLQTLLERIASCH